MGCCFKVSAKRWPQDKAHFYLCSNSHRHVGKKGELLHEGRGANRLSQECKDRVYEAICSRKSTKEILDGALLNLLMRSAVCVYVDRRHDVCS